MKKVTLTFNFDEKNEEQVCKDLNSFKRLIEPYAVDAKADVKRARKKKDDIVTITCYGKTEKVSRKDALAFYLEAMMNSEGSEQDRYTTIYCQLKEGQKVCSDEEDWDL